MEKVIRYADVELRAADEESRKISGVAAVFNQVADMGWFDEKIDPHAFDNCDMSDVVLNFNHNNSDLLAGTRNSSLKLSITDKGLEQESSIIDTNIGNDVIKYVRSGLIKKMSFAFEIDRDGGQEWALKEGDDKEHRTIKKISKLYDVSLVTFPAYEGTSVSARNIDELANEHLVERQKTEGDSSMDKRNDDVAATVETAQTEETATDNQEAANQEGAEPEDKTAEVTSDVTENNEDTQSSENRSNATEGEKRNMAKEKDLSLDSTVNAKAVEQRATATDPKDTPEVRQAYKDACLQKISIKEYRALFSTTEGMPIPTYLEKKVETAWEKANTFMNLVNQISVRGIIAVPVETDADDAVVHTEGTNAPAEEQITLGQVMLTPAAVKKWISYSDVLEAMTPEEFMDYLVDEVYYRVYKKANDGVIVSATDSNGNGIVGVVDAELSESISAGLSFNVFNEALAELLDAGDAVVVMNRRTFLKNYLSLKDLSDRPIFTVQTDNAGKPAYYANGLPVKFCDKLPALDDANAGDVWAVVGDFSGYKINLPLGKDVTIIRDIYTKAKEDMEILLGKLIAAGNVVKPKKFVNIKLPQSA